MITVGSWRLAVGSRRAGKLPCLLLTAYCLLACGIPNLETPACVESRDIVREFYSYHFGNGLGFSADSLKQRERFLTPGLVSQFAKVADGTDPFTTGTTDFPKAFRVGECKEISNGQTAFQVLLFWRDDNRTEQKTINVETVRTGDKWLINRINYE
jgi:hypothetical protein